MSVNRKIYVRRQGNVSTVFLDGNGTPVMFTDFHNPPADFPFTCPTSELPHRYPGADFVFIEEPVRPPPELAIDEAQLNAGLAEFKLSGASQATREVAPAQVRATASSLVDAVEGELTARIAAWRLSKDANELAELEAVCGFLLTVDEDTFDPIVKRLMEPPQAKEKKRVKLG